MPKEMNYTIDQLKEWVYYKDGQLIWKKKLKRGKRGEPVGSKCKKRGYIFFSFFNKRTQLHRVIFFYHKGYWPDNVDHIDRDVENNRIENLRECTASQSVQNRRKKATKCTSKYKGVYFFEGRKKYWAYISVNKKKFSLGYFDKEDEAAIAYNEAAKIHHKEFAVLNIIEP